MKHSELYRRMAAKTDPTNPERYLPLRFHNRDTALVIQFLVQNWLPESIIEETGLSKTEMTRLAVFLGMVHDCGKSSNAFIFQLFPRCPQLREWLKSLTIVEPKRKERDFKHHTLIGAAILSEMGAPDWVVSVVGAHHGKPLPGNFDPSTVMKAERNLFGCEADKPIWRSFWQENLDEALERAGYASLEDVPQTMTQPAQMLLVGLLIVADWLSSNTEFFPLIDVESDVDDSVYPARFERAAKKMKEFLGKWEPEEEWQHSDLVVERFGFGESNGVQRAIAQAAGESEKPGLFILEAPMGVGKTEASLIAGEILANREGESGLAFFLPSQATANAMFERVMSWIQNFEKKPTCWLDEDMAGSSGQLTIELAHGKARLNQSFAEMSESGALVDEDEDEKNQNKNPKESNRLATNAFFMGRKTQLLANFVVGTVDQMLMGALRQKHIMLKHLGLAGKVVVVDEVHAYDSYMSRYMDAMLNWLGAYRTPVILLSATLPGKRRGEMVSAYLGQGTFEGRAALEGERAYPLLTWTDGESVRTRQIELDARQTDVEILRGEDDAVIPFLRERLAEGGCAGVIVNTVKRAQSMAEQLKTAFPQYDVLLDHAQFIMPDRIRKEKQIMERLGRKSTSEQRDGLIVVGTQVLEQSLDIDCDVMVSDLCPMDLLLQRLGRLHRHDEHVRPAPMKRAACLVLGTQELEPGAKAVYGEYLLEKTAALLPDKIHLPVDISQLVQDAYIQNCDMLLPKPEGIERKMEEYNKELQIKESNANKNCIANAKRELSRRRGGRVIDGLLDLSIEMGEEQAKATVRDGLASIEVLVLQSDEDGVLHAAAQEEKPLNVRLDTMPCMEEAQIIMRQSLRLPHEFSILDMSGEVIAELEAIRQGKLSEWTHSPRIGRELFLLLDQNGCAELAGRKIRYDSMYGLKAEKEDGDGGKGV